MQVNTFKLSASYYEFSFENPIDCKSIHGNLYHYIMYVNNKLGWVSQFGLPTDQTMAAISCKNYKTYIKALLDLVDWKFIILVERSKNQWTSNIVALVKNTKATTKALPRSMPNALPNHNPTQHQSNIQSIDSINKPLNYETNKLVNKETVKPLSSSFPNPTFESLTLQYFVSQKVRITSFEKSWICEIGIRLKIKFPEKNAEQLFQVFMDMLNKLETHSFWKEKKHNLRYLSANFDEAWSISQASQKSDKKPAKQFSGLQKRS